jgi:predicted aspartyl protease
MHSYTRTLLAAVLSLAAISIANATDAERVLAQVREATGGARWDQVRAISYDAILEAAGLEGEMHSIESLRDGRSANRFDLGVTGGAEGNDGTASWTADAAGLVDIADSEPALSKARTERFLTARRYLEPTLDVSEWDLNTREDASGRTFQIVGFKPRSGDPVELWIDDSHHIAKLVLSADGQTIEWSDYREVDGLLLPHRIGTTSDGNLTTETITKYRVGSRIDAAKLARPRSKLRDVRMIGRNATLAATVEGGHLFVRASIGDHAPRVFVLDTGAGINVLTPEAAKEFGIASSGSINASGVGEQQVAVSLTRVAKLRVGPATLTDQSFAIIPLPFASVRIDGRPEVPVGLLGYDFFRRFRVTLDYAGQRVGIAPLSRSCAMPGPQAVQIFLDEDRTPEILARLDGVEAQWTIDVGASGPLTVARHVAERLGIAPDAGALFISQGGVGGATRERQLEFGRFEIGSLRVDRPIGGVSQQTAGAFASPRFGGNIGYETLRRFKMTFDYECRLVSLEPSREFASPEERDRSGVRWTRTPDGRRVAFHVVDGSPAALAGLAKDDQMLTINDRDSAEVIGDEISALQSAAPGSVVRYRIKRGEDTREIEVTLADFIPRASSAAQGTSR